MTSPDERASDPAARRVIVARHGRADREAAIEIAGILGTGVRLIAADSAVIVVPDGPTDAMTPWPRRMRPVLDLAKSGDGDIHLDAYASTGPAGGGMRARVVEHVLPSLSLSWQPAAQGRGETDGPEPYFPEAIDDVVEALSLPPRNAETLRRLLLEIDTAPTAGDLAAAFDLPPTAAALLYGEVDIDDVDGTVHAPVLDPWAAIRESLLARPEHDSLLARMRRWDYDRPALSVIAIAVAGLLAALAIVLPFRRGGWARGLVRAAGAVLAVDAIGSLVVFVAVRKRIRRGTR